MPPSATCFKGVTTIEGVWDLPMLGAERLDIEHKYQMLTDGPEITLTMLDGLPDDCVLVVRTEALREFEKSVSEKTRTKTTEKSIKDNPKAVTSLLKMVIAMAMEGYRYDPLSLRSQIPSEIVNDVEKLGLSIDADTVRKWLREGTELLDQNQLDNS